MRALVIEADAQRQRNAVTQRPSVLCKCGVVQIAVVVQSPVGAERLRRPEVPELDFGGLAGPIAIAEWTPTARSGHNGVGHSHIRTRP
jgi:hypothetical protein